ncbi:conjugative transposon protein TraM [Gillisia sp. Q332]|uniref:conjugative transposon protein TraM n=1 Tax=Gillisia xinjiangensis TaxID=3384765 RepID=UPI003918A466
MKIEKNKIVFGSVLAVVIIFIVSYSALVLGGNGDENKVLKETLVPELGEEQQEYKSKLDAVNALKEVRETNAPSIYDEKLLDSLGFYDPDLREKQKMKIVDSIYNSGRINYTQNSYRSNSEKPEVEKPQSKENILKEELQEPASAKELGLEHQLFYSTNPVLTNEVESSSRSENEILVEVDGNQTVKNGFRLKMRLTEPAIIKNRTIAKNTSVYGFISFQTNRALIEIENIDHQPVRLKAYDLQDGSEGIYVENSFRADASREVIDDVIQDINIAGLPQVGGIKKVFQRNNKNVTVTITNNYKLILKSPQGN